MVTMVERRRGVGARVAGGFCDRRFWNRVEGGCGDGGVASQTGARRARFGRRKNSGKRTKKFDWVRFTGKRFAGDGRGRVGIVCRKCGGHGVMASKGVGAGGKTPDVGCEIVDGGSAVEGAPGGGVDLDGGGGSVVVRSADDAGRKRGLKGGF